MFFAAFKVQVLWLTSWKPFETISRHRGETEGKVFFFEDLRWGRLEIWRAVLKMKDSLDNFA